MTPTQMGKRLAPARQTGSALIVAMIFLVILTILGISTMSTSRLELKMANNNQIAATAFQMAESGIEATLDAAALNLQNLPQSPNATAYVLPLTQTAGTTTTSTNYIMDSNIVAGNSINNSTALHYRTTSTSTVAGGGSATHIQGFYIIAPGQN